MTQTTFDPLIISSTIPAPDITQLTTMSLDGTGVFDALMRSVELHLQEEFTEGRINQEEYSQVYLGALGIVLPQAVAYLLNHQQERKITADIGLTRQKIVTELANTDNDIPADLGFNGTTAIEGLVADQKLINAQQLAVLAVEEEAKTAEKDLYGQKLVTEVGQTSSNLVPVKAAGYGFNDSDVIDGAMAGSKDRSVAEADLTIQKLVTELGQTSISKPSDLGKTVGVTIEGLVKAQTDLVVSQKAKADEEVVLLAQKTISELAQTSDTIPTDTNALNTSPTVTGVIDDQKILFTAQSEGFARDAEQKAARMMLDACIVQLSDSTRVANGINHLDDANLGPIMLKVAEGIGVTLPA